MCSGSAYGSERYSLRTPRTSVLQSGTVGGVTHAFKGNWIYELPFGNGRRFGAPRARGWIASSAGGRSTASPACRPAGCWTSGTCRLVGMSKQELQDAFTLRFDHAGRAIYMLPQDIVDNTMRAFSVSATTPSGYSGEVPVGRYLAPANGPNCIEIAQTNQFNGYGDCGVNNLVVTGPRLVRFDLSAVKRVPVKGRVNFEFRAEFLNAFNHPWFTPVTWKKTATLNRTIRMVIA